MATRFRDVAIQVEAVFAQQLVQCVVERVHARADLAGRHEQRLLACAWFARGRHAGGGLDDAGSERGDALDRAARQRQGLRGVVAGAGAGVGGREADAGEAGEAGPEAAALPAKPFLHFTSWPQLRGLPVPVLPEGSAATRTPVFALIRVPRLRFGRSP